VVIPCLAHLGQLKSKNTLTYVKPLGNWYDFLKDEGHTHLTVNHSIHFKHLGTRAHQQCERNMVSCKIVFSSLRRCQREECNGVWDRMYQKLESGAVYNTEFFKLIYYIFFLIASEIVFIL